MELGINKYYRWNSAFGIWHLEFGICGIENLCREAINTIVGTRHLAFGIWNLEFGNTLAFGIWNLELINTRHLAFGIWNLEFGNTLAFGIWVSICLPCPVTRRLCLCVCHRVRVRGCLVSRVLLSSCT